MLGEIFVLLEYFINLICKLNVLNVKCIMYIVYVCRLNLLFRFNCMFFIIYEIV